MIINLFFLIICGIFIGFILTSIGLGAALYIGCLITFFHYPGKVAAATSLITVLPSVLIGTYLYYKGNFIDFKKSNKLLIGALIGTIGSSLIIPYINKHYYQIIIHIILITLALTILYKILLEPKIIKEKSKSNKTFEVILAYFSSLVSGVMVGLAGMDGGGPLVAGMLLLGTPMIQAAAASSYIRIWTTSLGIILHWNTMHIAWLPAIFMMIGTIIGSAASPLIMSKLNNNQKQTFSKVIKPIVAITLLIMGIKSFL